LKEIKNIIPTKLYLSQNEFYISLLNALESIGKDICLRKAGS